MRIVYRAMLVSHQAQMILFPSLSVTSDTVDSSKFAGAVTSEKVELEKNFLAASSAFCLENSLKCSCYVL